MQKLAGFLVRVLTGCALALVFCASASAQSPPTEEPLGLNAALKAAQHFSLSLTAEESAARAAKIMAETAGQLPDPALRLSVDNLPVDGPMQYSVAQDFMTMRSVGVSQTWVRESKRTAAASAYYREEELAQARKTLELSELNQATASAWFKSHFSGLRLALLKQQRDELDRQAQALQAAYKSGRGSQTNVLMAQSEVAKMEVRILDAQARLDMDNIALKRWTGLNTTASASQEPDLTSTRFNFDHLAHEIQDHPDVAVMQAMENQAEAEVSKAEQDKSPDLNYSVMYSLRGPSFSNMLSFGVSVPLQLDQKDRQDKVIAARKTLVEKARQQRIETTRAHLAHTEEWVSAWQSGLKRLNLYERQIVPLASQQTQAALAEYRAGTGTLATVMAARNHELETRLERLQIAENTAMQWLKLEYLLPEDTTP